MLPPMPGEENPQSPTKIDVPHREGSCGMLMRKCNSNLGMQVEQTLKLQMICRFEREVEERHI